MAENTSIIIKGARVNNLKNIDVEIPRNKLVVITGLSGSGKSSLAFDTLYAEGQRLRGELEQLCPPVSGTYEQARMRFHQRHPACHCHRAES